MNLENALKGDPTYLQAAGYLLSRGSATLFLHSQMLEQVALQVIGRSVTAKERLAIQNTIQKEHEKLSQQWLNVLAFAIGHWGVKIVEQVLQDFPESLPQAVKAVGS